MQIELIFRGQGFEAKKLVEMPVLLQPGMKLGIVLDDGISQAGTELFPIHEAGYYLDREVGFIHLAEPIKYGKYKASGTPKLKKEDFSGIGWEIRTNSSIMPFGS